MQLVRSRANRKAHGGIEATILSQQNGTSVMMLQTFQYPNGQMVQIPPELSIRCLQHYAWIRLRCASVMHKGRKVSPMEIQGCTS